MLLYTDYIDKSATINRAKKVLREYKKVMRFIDNEIYTMQTQSSWNIGSPIFEKKNVSMVDKLNKHERRNSIQLSFIEKVQSAINKLDEDEIKIIYLTYLKGFSAKKLEKEIHISERQRTRLNRQAHLAFARAYKIEVLIPKVKIISN